MNDRGTPEAVDNAASDEGIPMSPIEVSDSPGNDERNILTDDAINKQNSSPLEIVRASVGEAIAKAEESLEASRGIVPRISPRGAAEAGSRGFQAMDSDKDSPGSKVSAGSDDVMDEIPIHDEQSDGAVKEMGCFPRLKARRRQLAGGEDGEQDSPDVQPLSYRKLYKYMDRYDVVLQILGIIGALGNGGNIPNIHHCLRRYPG
jgi:hypothetical protein